MRRILALLAITILLGLAVACRTQREVATATRSPASPSPPATAAQTETPSPTAVVIEEPADRSTPAPTDQPPTPAAEPAPFLPENLNAIEPDNVHQLQPLAEIQAPYVLFLAFSPAADRLVTISQEPADRSWFSQAWDLASGDQPFTIPDGPLLHFSPDGAMMATVSGAGQATFWDAESGELLRSIPVEDVLEISPDWQTAVTYPAFDSPSDISTLATVDMDSGQTSRTYDLVGSVVAVHFSPDGRQMAATTGGLTSSTTVWDMTSGEIITSFSEVDRLTFTPGGQLVGWLSGPEKVIRIVDGLDWSLLREIEPGIGQTPQFLAFSPDGRIIASATGHNVDLWDTSSGEKLSSLPIQAGNLAFSPDGRLLATSDYQGLVTLWGVLPE